MLGYFLTLLATALSLLVVDIIFPGVDIATFPIAIIAAIAIGLVNTFIRPILSVLSLPLNLLTLGIFSLVVNGICFSLAAFLVPGFSVHGALSFIFGPVILSAVNTGLTKYFAQKSSALTIDKAA
ncbi:phage holin family protein [Merismopedia glauca]|uniref:Phage holin family protein n=1 Tax=Merismopedia glauca CCAP 1448/3 TaxID=1296344 RepID=A0A2T1C0E2_9CYAN|nr:phage holin family protein [Merismopedia glauca]PSB01593.1 hypothetical protein C7B64_17460 [Merismopedia glauca CCAP 1448/3]